MPTNAGDIALSPDERFLAVTGWETILGNLYPISIVDLETRTLADKIQIPGLQLHWGAAFGPDGSVLFSASGGVRRLAVDASGKITNTGETFGPMTGALTWAPSNVEIAPSGTFAVGTYDGAPRGILITFGVPDMEELSRVRLDDPFADWAGFSADGRHLFAASSSAGVRRGTLQAFDVDPTTGIIGAHRWTNYGLSPGSVYGLDHVGLDSTGLRLFGEYEDRLLIRDARHGTLLGQLPLPAGTYLSTAVAR